MRILLIEDDEAVRQSLKEILELDGHELFLAADGSSALLLLDSMPQPQLILTDLEMYPMGGEEFLEKKNANPLLKKIPVIVMTGNADTSEIDETVLPKPFEIAKLLYAIETSQLGEQPKPPGNTGGRSGDAS